MLLLSLFLYVFVDLVMYLVFGVLISLFRYCCIYVVRLSVRSFVCFFMCVLVYVFFLDVCVLYLVQ